MDDGKGGWPPWSRIPSLKEMAEEMEIDFDDLMKAFEHDLTPEEIGSLFDISHTTAESLKEHFFRYGIGSVMGGD